MKNKHVKVKPAANAAPAKTPTPAPKPNSAEKDDGASQLNDYDRKLALALAVRKWVRKNKDSKAALVFGEFTFPPITDPADFIPAMQRYGSFMAKHGDGAIMSLDISQPGVIVARYIALTDQTGEPCVEKWAESTAAVQAEQSISFVKGQPRRFSSRRLWPPRAMKKGKKPNEPGMAEEDKAAFISATNECVFRLLNSSELRPHERVIATGGGLKVWSGATAWGTASDKPLSIDTFKKIKEAADAVTDKGRKRICECGCGKPIPPGRGNGVRYVDERHALDAKNRRRREERKAKKQVKVPAPFKPKPKPAPAKKAHP